MFNFLAPKDPYSGARQEMEGEPKVAMKQVFNGASANS